MKLNPHLFFAGNCEQAFQLYQRCLGGTIQAMIPYQDTPAAEQAPPEWRGKIMHATLKVGDNVLYGADVFPGRYQAPAGFHIAISVDEPTEAEKVFGGLSEGGTIEMPLQKTFWARAYGIVVDRFGVSWEINCEQPQ